MNENNVDIHNSNSVALSRRDFLVHTALTAGAVSIAGGSVSKALAAGAIDGHMPNIRLVQVKSDRVLTDRGIHEELLKDLLEILLTRLTKEKTAEDAWRKILKPDDIIGLKFNSVGAAGLGTNDGMARALVDSLAKAGFKSSQIVLIEVTPAIRSETQTLAPAAGWTEKVYDFGSGQDRLAAWMDQVTAIINVPFLKHHNIAGMTCCLKNISHAVVKHPAQFHSNNCSPYIGDIVSIPEIRNKLRFHVVNGLRVVFDRGPEVIEDYVWSGKFILGGFDPVAIDTACLQTLNRIRAKLGLEEIVKEGNLPEYLAKAADRNLGTIKLHEIAIEKVKL